MPWRECRGAFAEVPLWVKEKHCRHGSGTYRDTALARLALQGTRIETNKHTNEQTTMNLRTSSPPDARRISKLGQTGRGAIVVLAVVGLMVYVYFPMREMQWRLQCCEQLRRHGQGKVALADLRCPRCDGPYLLEKTPEPSEEVPFTYIVAYEPIENHGGAGGALLYSDGHAEFLGRGKYKATLHRSRELVEDYLARRDGARTSASENEEDSTSTPDEP